MKFSRRQQEILDISKKMFVENGYAETTMRDIAAKMNVKAASLYAHISSKEEILEWICEDVYNRFYNALKDLEQKDMDKDLMFAEFIKRYITEILVDLEKFEVFLTYWRLCEKHFEKYTEGTDELFFKLKILLLQNLTDDRQMPCFHEDATTYIIMDILNNIPKYVNKENPDIHCVVNEIQKRILYGYTAR